MREDVTIPMMEMRDEVTIPGIENVTIIFLG
jgi:hypothetical protein